MKITVLGSGGWGTALALLLLRNGHDVTLWSHSAERVRSGGWRGKIPGWREFPCRRSCG